MRSVLFFLWIMALVGGLGQAGEVDTPLDDAAVDQAFAPLQSYVGLEKAIAKMELAIGESAPGATPQADLQRLGLANLLIQLGRNDQALSQLMMLRLLASTESLKAAANALWGLAWAQVYGEKGQVVSECTSFALADHYANAIVPARLKTHCQRMTKDYRFRALIKHIGLAAAADKRFSTAPTEQITVDLGRALLGLLLPEHLFALENEKAQTGKAVPISEADVLLLEQNRPWQSAFLRSAERLSSELYGLELLLNGPDKVVQGWQKLRQAELAHATGQFSQAVRSGRSALANFRQSNCEEGAVRALSLLADGMAAEKSPRAMISAADVYKKLIQVHESRAAQLGTEGLGRYLAHHRDHYQGYRNLLMRACLSATDEIQAFQPDLVRRLILHSSRMQLRPVRREIMLYRAMVAQGYRDEMVRDLAAASVKLADARGQLEATRRKGVIRDTFRGASEEKIVSTLNRAEPGETVFVFAGEPSKNTPMVWEGGPYAQFVKEKARSKKTLTAHGGEALASLRANAELPTDWASLLEGMGPDEAIVAYMQFDLSEPLAAAVMTKGNEPRIVRLAEATLEKVQALVGRTIDLLGAGLADAEPNMTELGELIWTPLGNLPNQVTIVPILSLLGIPFEALKQNDGRYVIQPRGIKYALGLSDRMARQSTTGPLKSAFVIGATEFMHEGLDAIEASREEITSLRSMFQSRGWKIHPENGFPPNGSDFLNSGNRFEVLHISTHAVWDKSDPMFDFLAFPRADIFALEIALSPVQANLAVFSACNLFKARAGALNPVSGISTAALSNLSPQVVTTLWSVNADTTRLFMQRFYDELLKTPRPVDALAQAKRDFLNPERLKEWMNKKNIPPPAGCSIEDLIHPFYWAPFVLVACP
ncbi:CHAT domain-containing protein [Desulfosarcina ovata]|uniref:CHAT domain-containing protein n=1 Tax=Desulfosarcina ovata subsp. ovata TaxID=2752305 RepID=A0A5K8AKS6_9BACT|nr:CHAT domain-containing protein [Desulfosarcina ovata]BBO93109.1 hypothetical protein DSCOOX_62890 [Desulfosarcina ovata subsp. ovata]